MNSKSLTSALNNAVARIYRETGFAAMQVSDMNEPEEAVECFLDIQKICQQAIDSIRETSGASADPQDEEMTLSIPGRLSTAIRFEATMAGKTPESIVFEALACESQSYLESFETSGNRLRETLMA